MTIYGRSPPRSRHNPKMALDRAAIKTIVRALARDNVKPSIPAPVAPGELSNALPQQAQDAITRIGAETFGMQPRQRPATRPFSSAAPEAARAAAARITRL